jgi:4-hydroxy-3-methylbut-2-enyl diphosphate reductase
VQADRVVEVAPRGFCAGVEMAVKALAWLVLRHDGPVFCFHHVVHNEQVVDRFRRLGVVFVDDVADVPAGAPLLLSAHGSTPAVQAAAAARSGEVVDAVCPLVAKVHRELRAKAAEGHHLVYVGHPGHDEAVAATAVAPEVTSLVPTEKQLPALPAGTAVAVLAQTTLPVDEWDDVLAAARRRYGAVWTAPKADVCFATTNRQAAVREVAPSCDAFVVVGSASSANTAALVRVAEGSCPVVVRVDGAHELPAGRFEVVGVTAGASAPETAIVEVLAALGGARRRIEVVAEDVYFPPPPALRPTLGEGLLDLDRRSSAEEVLRLVERTKAGRAA